MRYLMALLVLIGSPATGADTLSAVTVNGTRFSVEVAATDAARRQGLMHRPALADGQGMLFVYDTPQPVVFWNKNVHFPIDILYFGADRRLLCLDEEVPPCVKACPRYRCDAPVKYVLEVGAGTAGRLGRPGSLELLFEKTGQ